MNNSRNNRNNNRITINSKNRKRAVHKTLKICKQVPASKINEYSKNWHSETGKNQWGKVKNFYAKQCNRAQVLARIAEPNTKNLNTNYVENIAKNIYPGLNTNVNV